MVRSIVEKLKNEFEKWLDNSNVPITKDYIIEMGITAEEIYTSLIEAMKEHENWFEDYEKVNFNVEKISWYDKEEGEWKPYDDDCPLSHTFKLKDEKDIIEALEKRKDEVIELINTAINDLLETNDWEEDEALGKYRVSWALNIYLT